MEGRDLKPEDDHGRLRRFSFRRLRPVAVVSCLLVLAGVVVFAFSDKMILDKRWRTDRSALSLPDVSEVLEVLSEIEIDLVGQRVHADWYTSFQTDGVVCLALLPGNVSLRVVTQYRKVWSVETGCATSSIDYVWHAVQHENLKMLDMHWAQEYEVEKALWDSGAFHYRGLVFDVEKHDRFYVFYVGESESGFDDRQIDHAKTLEIVEESAG